MAITSCNIPGYALIELPELIAVIYRLIKKKFLVNHNTSTSDLSTIPVRNDVELTSVSSPDVGVGTNDGEGDTHTTSPEKIFSNKRYKLEESITNLTQKIDEILLKLQYHDQVIKKLSKRKLRKN